MAECIGCGRTIWTPANEHQTGEWCIRQGECQIEKGDTLDGVNRLREAFLELRKKMEG